MQAHSTLNADGEWPVDDGAAVPGYSAICARHSLNELFSPSVTNVAPRWGSDSPLPLAKSRRAALDGLVCVGLYAIATTLLLP
mmetsp:Transcript_13100/g.32096  ORF Transcript_13100/g.32096 Transcript_13100/m.32096 type:complete len:83 (+) Transcript_13100:1711-1959(+)